MLYSKALESAKQYEDCIEYCRHILNGDMKFTDNNRLHLMYREAKCMVEMGMYEKALRSLVDLEPLLPQFYVPLSAGKCYLHLKQPLEALGCFAAALLMNPKPSYARQALETVARNFEFFDIPRDVAAQHAKLDQLLCTQENWTVRDYEIIVDEFVVDGPGSKAIKEGLRPHWKEWSYYRYLPGSGTIVNFAPNATVGFIKDDFSNRTLIFRAEQGKHIIWSVGKKVMFRAKRSWDKKKERLGWEAVKVAIVEGNI